jgi:hypothetical protein
MCPLSLVHLSVILVALFFGLFIGLMSNWLWSFMASLFVYLVLVGSIFFPWHFRRQMKLNNDHKY